jgi:drug/metabolite transporter (DMT)-like permease
MSLQRVLPYILLTCTTLFWGGNWVIARGIQGLMSPVAMAFWRWLAALVILLPFVAGPMRREWPAIRRSWKILAVLGVLGVGAFNTLTYTGLKYTTATNGALLNSVIPILIIAISFVFFRERVTWRKGAGVLVSLAGVATIISRGDAQTLLHLRLNPGDLWVLAAMVGWALYTVCLRWRPAHLSSRAFTGSLIAIGVAAILPVFAWDYALGHRSSWNGITLASVAYFAIFPSVLAYFFWNAAVARVGAERAGLFLHLMPVFGAGLSMAFLGESLLPFHFAGAALIFSGIFIASHAGAVRASRPA